MFDDIKTAKIFENDARLTTFKVAAVWAETELKKRDVLKGLSRVKIQVIENTLEELFDWGYRVGAAEEEKYWKSKSEDSK